MKIRTLFFCALLLLGAVGAMMGQNVVMNEIYSRGVAGNMDWIELYNPGNVAVDISTYKIYDIGGGANPPTKVKKPFPSGTIIPAKGFYVIITDTASFVGDLSAFGLSSSGEKVWLEDSTSGTILDTVTYGATATAAQSYGRGPDGGKWTVLNTITRGTSNGKIVMNEIYSRGVAGNMDWIEIYNGVSAAVNVSGYRIYDVGGQGATKPKKAFPVGTIIPEKGFFVIITDTIDFVGDLSGFGLSSSGEKVWLEDTTTSTIMDTVTFGAMSTTQTWGRQPDGGAWQLLNTITRGTSNGTGTAVDDDMTMVADFALGQNYPNPFNPNTVVSYQLSVVSQADLRVYDMLGREVAVLVSKVQNPGTFTVSFDASALPSGMYLYRLTAGTFSQTRKMLLTK